MSNTIIRAQCRALRKVFVSSPSIYQEHCNQGYHSTRSSKSRQTKRLVHTARAPTHHVHSRHPISKHDLEHANAKELKDDLRLLLRDIAQPVAVVTSFMPATPDAGSSSSSSGNYSSGLNVLEGSEANSGTEYHGATLSSFTSIAMDPYPLVAFSLRIPSRMATTLSSLVSSQNNSPSPSHMVINLLSASQAPLAITFSRPDLYPAPFVSGSDSKKPDYSLSKDGLPILHGVIGALSCKLVGSSIPLHDLEYFGSKGGAQAQEADIGQGCVTSELFIARVVRVEKVQNLGVESQTDDEEDLRTLPLVYHRRNYTSCHPRPSRVKGTKP